MSWMSWMSWAAWEAWAEWAATATALASAVGACASGGFGGLGGFGEEAKSRWLRELEREEGVAEEDVVGDTRAEIMLREFIFLSPRSHEEKRVPRGFRNPASVCCCVYYDMMYSSVYPINVVDIVM